MKPACLQVFGGGFVVCVHESCTNLEVVGIDGVVDCTASPPAPLRHLLRLKRPASLFASTMELNRSGDRCGMKKRERAFLLVSTCAATFRPIPPGFGVTESRQQQQQ